MSIDFRMIDRDQSIFDKQIDLNNFLDKNVVVIIVVTSKHDFDKYKK